MNGTTTQTFQTHLFFHLFSLENQKLAQKNPNFGNWLPPTIRSGEYLYAYMYASMNGYVYMYLFVYLYMYLHVYVYTNMHLCMSDCMCIYMYMYVHFLLISNQSMSNLGLESQIAKQLLELDCANISNISIHPAKRRQIPGLNRHLFKFRISIF